MAAELVLRGEGGLRGMLAPLKAHVIDAQSLDADLMRVLQGMWSEVCAQAGTRLCTSLQPELDGLLRGALWYLSMWRCSATLGQQMQNLHCVAANSARAHVAVRRRQAWRSGTTATREPRGGSEEEEGGVWERGVWQRRCPATRPPRQR